MQKVRRLSKETGGVVDFLPVNFLIILLHGMTMSTIWKKIYSTLAFFFFFHVCFTAGSLPADDKNPVDLNPPTVTSSVDEPDKDEDEKEETETKKGFNVNIDASLLYGLYNNIFSAISFIQNHEKFAYQLNSEFKRSNDFGYKNSSFYNNEIGFTGKARFFKSWTFIPELTVNNESHGMFDDETFNREEKDKIVILFKNEYKPTPARWQFNVGGAQYVHRLSGDSFNFSCYKINEEIKWEYVWSAANSIIINHYYWQYFYDYDGDNGMDTDSHVANEILANFKITEYIKLNGGGIIDWNLDSGWFPSGKLQISSTGLKYFSIEGAYSYILKPFAPENVYFEQKYVYPAGGLPAAKIHIGALDTSFDISFKKKTSFYLKKFKLKLEGAWERSNNFYNFLPSTTYINSGILAVEAIPVTFIHVEPSILFSFNIFDHSLEMKASYLYQYFISDDIVTYHPSHTVKGEVIFKTTDWELAFENSYQNAMYTDPATGREIGGRILGNIELQYKMIDTLYIDVKLQNIYNNSYSLVDGFPEPGFRALAGLRIII